MKDVTKSVKLYFAIFYDEFLPGHYITNCAQSLLNITVDMPVFFVSGFYFLFNDGGGGGPSVK